MEKKKIIGIIGYGNMGSAIAKGIKKTYPVTVFDKDTGKTAEAKDVRIAAAIEDAVRVVDAIILAVKPQDFDSLLDEIKPHAQGRLLVSIAAGIPTGYIEKRSGAVRVIRVMPNIGATIGEAESSLCKGRTASAQDLAFVRGLFDLLGKTWEMEERLIDAATAIAGSGPAYIFYDLESRHIDPLQVPKEIEQEYISRLKAAAEEVGFDAVTAQQLASSTTSSSLHLCAATGLSPAALRALVTSKGGTTAAALEQLAQGRSWTEAAHAAKRRAEELSKKE